jgi:hypothetical protein
MQRQQSVSRSDHDRYGITQVNGVQIYLRYRALCRETLSEESEGREPPPRPGGIVNSSVRDGYSSSGPKY